METKDLIENSTAKLHKKNMDMIVANNVKVPGAGFGVDTNVVTLITESISTALPLQSKDDVAMHIADVIVEAKRRKQKKVRQYRIILSADTASEVRQMPSQKRR